METLQNINSTLHTFDAKKEAYNKALKSELIGAIKTIESKIAKVSLDNNLSYKKSRNVVKKNLFSDFEAGTINKKLLRAFNIALTLEYRNIKNLMNLSDILSIAQIETISNYFTKAEVEEVIKSDTPIETFKDIIKSYKVETKTTKLDTTKKKISGK